MLAGTRTVSGSTLLLRLDGLNRLPTAPLLADFTDPVSTLLLLRGRLNALFNLSEVERLRPVSSRGSMSYGSRISGMFVVD